MFGKLPTQSKKIKMKLLSYINNIFAMSILLIVINVNLRINLRKCIRKLTLQNKLTLHYKYSLTT